MTAILFTSTPVGVSAGHRIDAISPSPPPEHLSPKVRFRPTFSPVGAAKTMLLSGPTFTVNTAGLLSPPVEDSGHSETRVPLQPDSQSINRINSESASISSSRNRRQPGAVNPSSIPASHRICVVLREVIRSVNHQSPDSARLSDQ